MSKKPLTHQQKRWNRHWNYRLDDDRTAMAIFKAARGKLTAKDACKCADAVWDATKPVRLGGNRYDGDAFSTGERPLFSPQQIKKTDALLKRLNRKINGGLC